MLVPWTRLFYAYLTWEFCWHYEITVKHLLLGVWVPQIDKNMFQLLVNFSRGVVIGFCCCAIFWWTMIYSLINFLGLYCCFLIVILGSMIPWFPFWLLVVNLIVCSAEIIISTRIRCNNIYLGIFLSVVTCKSS